MIKANTIYERDLTWKFGIHIFSWLVDFVEFWYFRLPLSQSKTDTKPINCDYDF